MAVTAVVMAIVEVDRMAPWIVNVTTPVMDRNSGAYDGHIVMPDRSRHGLPLRRHWRLIAAAVMVAVSAVGIATTAAPMHPRRVAHPLVRKQRPRKKSTNF